MGRCIWTERAVRDLNDIHSFIAAHDVGAADRLIDEIDRKADLYAGNPLLGEARPELGPDFRAFRVGKYVAVYRPLTDGIVIARLIHSARDLPRLFGEP